MTSSEVPFRKSLAEWSASARSRSHPRWPTTLPESFRPSRSLRAAERVQKQLGDQRIEPPSLQSLDDLYWRAIARLRHGTPLAGWPRPDLNKLPWVFFYTPKASRRNRQLESPDRLGDNSGLVRSYGEWLAQGRRKRAVLPLLHEFLRVYPVDSQSFGALRGILDKETARAEAPSLWRWRQRCTAFRLLDGNGDLAFVKTLVSRSGPVSETLKEAGFDAGLATAGLLRSGLRKELRTLEKLLKRDPAEPTGLDRTIEVLEFQGGLRFDDLRTAIAESLLRPFLQKEPEPTTRERILSFLMRHLGHPNLPAGKRNWRGVSNDLRNVVLRWLVGESLDVFFAVVKETALDRHWKYREKFWKAHFEAGLIDRAWFIFGSRARTSMERLEKRDELSMGTLLGSEGGQSVLLLHVNGMPGMTVAEWSHSGACRIWNDGNPEAPKLYESEYSRHGRRGRQLMGGANHRQTHHGSESGRWQDEMAEWIRYYTDVSIRRDDYMPTVVRDGRFASTGRTGRAPAAPSRARGSSKMSEVDRRWAVWRSGRHR